MRKMQNRADIIYVCSVLFMKIYRLFLPQKESGYLHGAKASVSDSRCNLLREDHGFHQHICPITLFGCQAYDKKARGIFCELP